MCEWPIKESNVDTKMLSVFTSHLGIWGRLRVQSNKTKPESEEFWEGG